MKVTVYMNKVNELAAKLYTCDDLYDSDADNSNNHTEESILEELRLLNLRAVEAGYPADLLADKAFLEAEGSTANHLFYDSWC